MPFADLQKRYKKFLTKSLTHLTIALLYYIICAVLIFNSIRRVEVNPFGKKCT
jgi:uncharacterized membrane protein